MLRELRRLFRLPWRRPDAVDGDVDAELDFHLSMRTEELKALGLPADQARAEAVRRFGDVGEARAALVRTDVEAAHAARRADWLGDLLRDLRFAGRELRRDWTFALVAVVVLGLGIGLTTAMASLFDRLALRPLPYPNADRLGQLWLATGQGDHVMRVTPNRKIRETTLDVPGIERVDAHRSQDLAVDFPDGTEMLPVRMVSPGLLGGLGARALLGRTFQAEDSAAAAPLTAIVAHQTWQRRFGGAADIVGRSIRVDGKVATVVGVLRPGFDLVSLDGGARAEIWLPLRDDVTEGGGDFASLLVTIAPGATMSAIGKTIDARITAAAEAGDPMMKSFSAVLLGADQIVGSSLRRTLGFLLGAVGLVLLVACANVAALLLGQAVSRFQEFGIRAALGSGRARVVRQLLAESSLLGILGVGAGLLVAVAVLALARATRPDTLLTVDEVRLSGLTLGVAVAVALVATVGFGLAPIWAVSRADVATSVVGRTRRATDGLGAGRLRTILVVGQIAVTLVLLLGAGLLVKSFVRERTLPLGFDAPNLAQVSISMRERDFPDSTGRDELARSIVERIRRIPGVIAAAQSGNSPVDFGVVQGEFLAEDRPVPETEAKIVMPARWVGPDFFAVTGVPLVAGRTFSADTGQAEVVIDAATARRVWGTLDVVGKRVRYDRSGGWRTIVGVAGDLRGFDGFDGVPALYEREYAGETGHTILARLADARVLREITRAVREAHPAIRIRSAALTLDAIEDQLAGTRFTMAIVACFSILALVLAMVGLYGVISYGVRRRTFEFGVRLALGAPPARVRGLVLREGLLRIGGGVAVGLLGSVGLVRVIRGMLYQMSPWDPTAFGVAAALLFGVGAAAIWIPARRASRVDPLEAIRAE
ncbi:MAG: ADOP family duplicated permease [Gemmatimonadales bacterium]|nr:ADOP family duplicated permease [Gemmatimonadales bacterium]